MSENDTGTHRKGVGQEIPSTPAASSHAGLKKRLSSPAFKVSERTCYSANRKEHENSHRG